MSLSEQNKEELYQIECGELFNWLHTHGKVLTSYTISAKEDDNDLKKHCYELEDNKPLECERLKRQIHPHLQSENHKVAV